MLFPYRTGRLRGAIYDSPIGGSNRQEIILGIHKARDFTGISRLE